MAWSQDVVINDATVTSALQNHGNVAMTNNWAIVGSASPEGGTRVGSALVYKYENDTWVQKQRLTAEGDIKNYMDFGYSVSITDSFAFVAAPSSKTQSQKGEVYVFKLNNGTWTRHSKLEPEASAGVENGNMFGYDIEVSNTTLIIGCPWYDYNGMTESGAFFVSDYDSNTDTWSTPALNTDYSSLVTGSLSIGRSVSIYGDYACIGTGGQRGKVFNYKRVDGTWQSMGDDYVFDGNDCAVGENYLLIGFYFSTQTGGGFNSGQAHIYEKTENGWENPVALTGPGGILDAFGDGLDINDSYAIVGAYTHTISDRTGGVCIFQRGEGNTWTNVTSGNGGVIEGSEISYAMFGRSVAMTPNGSYFIANQQPTASAKNVGTIFKNPTITHPTAANQTSTEETSGEETSENTSTSFTGVSYNGVRDTLRTTPATFASSAYNKKNNTTFIIDRGSGILKVTNHTDDTTFELAFTEKSDSSSPNYNNNYSFVYSVATFDDFVLIGATGYKYNANVAGVGTAYILKYSNGWPQTVTTNDRLFPDTISADDSSLANLLYGSNVQLFNHDNKTWAAVSTSAGDVSGKAIFLFTKDSNDTWSFNHKVEDPANNAGWPTYWNFAGDMLYTRGQQSNSNLFYKYNSSSGVWEYSFTPSITFDYGYVSNNYFMGIPSSVDNTVQIYKINDTKTDLVAETVFSAVTSTQPGFLSLSISDTAAIYTDNRKSSGIKILKNDNDTWSEVSITYNVADPNLDGAISKPLVTNNNISYIEANPIGFPITQPQAFIVLKLDGVDGSSETTETTETNESTDANQTSTVDTTNFTYYYFDYNETFDNKETDSGWDNYGSSETQYFGYNRIHKDGIAPFIDTQNNHFIFGYSSYDVNSPTGDFSAYSYEYGVGTPGNINAGRYSYTVKFGGRDDGIFDFYRNTTNTKNDSWELGENYTFQNQVKGRPTNIIVSRKNSNAFTFDTTSTGPFGTTQLNDTAGNSIANPRWGFTNLKLVVKTHNDDNGNATERISEFYMLTDTELILKITPTFEQNWKIQANTGFWKLDNNGSIFSSAVTNVTSTGADVTAPTFSSAAIAEDTPTKIEITLDEDIADNASVNIADFSVTVAGEASTISAVAVSTGKVEITLETRAYQNQEVSVTYTKSATSSQNIADAAGNAVETFTSQTVTNSTTTEKPASTAIEIDTTNFSYYYFDYNDRFDNRATDAYWTTDGPAANENGGYLGLGKMVKNGTFPFVDTLNGHLIFAYGLYGLNSSTGDFSSYTYEYGNGTPGNLDAGKYSFCFRFVLSNNDDDMTNFYRNTTSTSNDTFVLGENYTFQNALRSDAYGAIILVTRKNSNAFTFDTTSTSLFGTTQLNDTAGNTISNPRWGFTNLKLVVKAYNDANGNSTGKIAEYYLVTDTELIVKFNATLENDWQLNLSNQFWTPDNDGSFFLNAVTNVTPNTTTETTETTEDNTESAAETALAEEQQAAETEATSSGISTADINIFKTGTFTVSNGKSTLDASRKTKLLQLMQGASNATEKRSKRRAALKLLFSQTANLKRLVVPKADLDLPNTFTKSNAVVVKAGETFNINDLESDEGFYSVLGDGETFTVATTNTTLTFTRNDDINDNEIYNVSASSWDDIIINSSNVTSGTFSGTNKEGTLIPDSDSVTIDGQVFIIGSIADGGTSDITPPAFSSALVTEASSTNIEITFDENVANNQNVNEVDFTVYVDGVESTISSVSVSNGKVAITLETQVYSNEVVLVSYNKSTTTNQNLADAEGNAVDSFTFQTVTNSTTTEKPSANTGGGGSISFSETQLKLTEAIGVAPQGPFGKGVAVNGNYAAVSKQKHTGSNPNTVYIFKKVSESWSLIQKIEGQSRSYDGFGRSLAMEGDILAIGSSTHYSTNPHNVSYEKGGVYIYKLNTSTGLYEEHNPKNRSVGWRSDTVTNDSLTDASKPHVLYPTNNSSFGYNLDLWWDGDKEYRLIVSQQGHRYVNLYKFDDTDSSTQGLGWQHIIFQVRTEGTSTKDRPVSIYENYFVVGEYGYETGQYGTGVQYSCAHIYKYNSGWDSNTWTLDATLKSSDWDQTTPPSNYQAAYLNDEFGWSVSIYKNTVFVGARRSGKAYVFNKDANGVWGVDLADITTNGRTYTGHRGENQIISSATASASYSFAARVNNNSDDYALISAQRKPVDGVNNIGSIYLYKLVSGTWQEQTEQIVPTIPNGTGVGTKTWSSSSEQSYFGSSIDFDGTNIIASGEGFNNNNTTDGSTTYKGMTSIFNITEGASSGGSAEADTTAPTFSSAAIMEATPTILKINFDENIADNANVSASDFSVTKDSENCTISAVSVSSGKVEITLYTRIYLNQVVTVSYTKSTTSSQNIADAAGNAVETFASQSVTNTTTSTELDGDANTLFGNSITTSLKSGSFNITNGKATLDTTRKGRIRNLILNASDNSDKRNKRRLALKLLFAQNALLKKLVIAKNNLDLPTEFTKTKAVVVKAGERFNVSELGTDEGFYSVLDDGETVEIITQNTTLTFTRNDDIDGTELYEVSALDWTDIVINSDNVTGTFSDSNTSGNLKVNDKVTIDGRIFIIGSIADGGGSGGSAGDPYVFPIKSSIPVKLPNKNAFYRMFEQGDNYINVEVGRCTDEHKNRMLDYAKRLTPITHNIVMDGYFYQNVFISAEGHQLAIDYNTKKGNCDDEAMKFFKIKQSKKLFDCGEFYEDANCWSITWDTKENKKIQVELMFFPNPHIENGINIIPSTLKKSTGLIVDNYKPKLMELPSLTKEKFNKLHRRLDKCKKRHQKMSIKSKNEKWHFN